MHLRLGRVGQLDEARAATEKAAKLDPARSGQYYFNLGAILYNSNQDDAALEAFERVPRESPEFAKAKEHIDDIRHQRATFKSTISAYLESAKNRFQNLKGEQTLGSPTQERSLRSLVNRQTNWVTLGLAVPPSVFPVGHAR